MIARRARWIWLLVLLFVGGVYAAWTPHEGLGQLGRDGPRYMMMADHYAAYRQPDPVYAAMAIFSHLPPLYPMILAWTGAADDLYRAHLVTNLFLLFGLGAWTWWLLHKGATLEQAALLMLLLATLPGSLLTGLLIQSEYLYLFLSLLALGLMAAYRRSTKPEMLYAAGLAVGAASLSRTIGVCLLPPLLFCAKRGTWRSGAIAVMLAVCPAVGWHLVHHSPTSYGDQLQAMYSAHPWETLLRQIEAELPALRHGFAQNLLDDPSWGPLADLLGLLCLGCTLVRAARLEEDGIYLCAYLAVLVAWPFPEEAMRFLWPILPLLLAQPLLIASGWRRHVPGRGLHPAAVTSLALLLLPSTLAALEQFADRYWSAPYSGIANARGMVYWYAHDPAYARATAAAENAFIGAVQLITAEVPDKDCVLATRPDVVSYYAHRFSKRPPLNSVPDPDFGQIARSSGCNYVFGTAFKDNIFPVALHPLPRLAPDLRMLFVYSVDRGQETDIVAALGRFVPAKNP